MPPFCCRVPQIAYSLLRPALPRDCPYSPNEKDKPKTYLSLFAAALLSLTQPWTRSKIAIAETVYGSTEKRCPQSAQFPHRGFAEMTNELLLIATLSSIKVLVSSSALSASLLLPDDVYDTMVPLGAEVAASLAAVLPSGPKPGPRAAPASRLRTRGEGCRTAVLALLFFLFFCFRVKIVSFPPPHSGVAEI